MNSMKRQKDRTLKDELPQVGRYPIWLLEKSGEIASERTKRLSQSRNDIQLWMCPVVKVTSEAVKNNIA